MKAFNSMYSAAKYSMLQQINGEEELWLTEMSKLGWLYCGRSLFRYYFVKSSRETKWYKHVIVRNRTETAVYKKIEKVTIASENRMPFCRHLYLISDSPQSFNGIDDRKSVSNLLSAVDRLLSILLLITSVFLLEAVTYDELPENMCIIIAVSAVLILLCIIFSISCIQLAMYYKKMPIKIIE